MVGPAQQTKVDAHVTLVRETEAPIALVSAAPARDHDGRQWQRRYGLALLITDVVVVGAAMAVRPDGTPGAPSYRFRSPHPSTSALLSVIFGLIWLGLLTAYRSRSRGSSAPASRSTGECSRRRWRPSASSPSR